jgi:RNA polymerase sigma-70 factor (ECF subfamily)
MAPSAPVVLRVVPKSRDDKSVTDADGDSADAERDRQLIALARAGSQRAFGQLMQRYERRAYALALNLVRDENDAHELVQEAFLRVYRGLPAFNGDSRFFTWLYRIVKNLAIDLQRKVAHRETDSIEDYDFDRVTQVAPFGHSSPDPLDDVCRSEIVDHLRDSIAALPSYHRGVILMHMEGRSYEEMAREMGVSKGTIMSRLFHARQKLHHALSECCGERM